MPDINPFDLNPEGPFQPLLNYWYCTMQRLIYYDRDDLMNSALILAGATISDRERIEQQEVLFGDNISRTDIYHLPMGDIVSVRGSNTNGQLLAQAARSGTVSIEAWDGRVSAYFGVRSLQILAAIGASLQPPWIACGHSLGGAIAGLISQNGASKVWTIGQPREGNADYAESRDQNIKLRLYNDEDLVPKVPASFSVDTGNWLGLVPFFDSSLPELNYWHWGKSWVSRAYGITLYPFPDRGGFVDVVAGIGEATGGSLGLWAHQPEVYAFRIRSRMHYRFPADKSAASLPGLAKLDEINQAINIGPLAEVRGGAVNWFIKPSTASRQPPGGQGDAVDAVQDWEEFSDVDESAISPFRCPEE